MKSLPLWKPSLEPYNTRAPEIWNIISRVVDFEGKAYLDIGCGYGDMLIMAHLAKAEKVWGLDNNPKIVDRAKERVYNEIGITPDIAIGDAEDVSGYRDFDIISCFSVLPYLRDPNRFLRSLQEDCEITLLEVQYADDGPGFEHIKNDKDMWEWLKEIGWKYISNLGYTNVEIRNTKRTIWRCRNA